MKRPYAVLLAAALSLSASHALADGVFKAALYDDAGRVVLARAGGVASDAGGPAVRLVVKAGADEPIRVRAVDPAGAVLSSRTLRTDALGIASLPLVEVSEAGRSAAIQVEQDGSGRVLSIGLGAARVAAR